MELKAHIHAIYLAPFAGAPMQSVNHAQIRLGLGIEGDRYGLGTGAFSSAEPAKVRHISLIALSGIEDANERLCGDGEPTFSDSETRRNIVLKGISAADLNNLVGEKFQLGNIFLLGTELCEPCERPAKLLKRSSFIAAFEGRGGIRAEILTSGMLTINDSLLMEK